ncbi:MAG: hypothetical protein ABEH77_02750 [Halobacteriaceae archaeon]
MATLLDNAVRLIELFTEVALADPLSAVLLAVGAALTGAAVTAFAYLTAGAAASLFTPA